MRNAIPNIFLHIIFLLCSLHSYSQNERIDSLKKVLATEKEDTNNVNTLNELSAALDHDRNSAMQYAKDALSLARKINFKNGEGRAFYQMGEAEIGSNYIGVRGNINEALAYFNNAVDIFKTTNDQIEIAETYEAIARTYADVSQNYPESEKYFYDALRIYEKVGDKNKLASISLDLGLSYTDNGNDSAGFRILENSLNTFKEMNDSRMIASTNIAIGLAYYYKSKNEDALRYFNNALNIYKAMGKRTPDFGIPWSKGNIANVYIDQGEVAFRAGNKKLAFEKQEAALALIKERLEMEDAGNMSHRETYIQMGNCYKDLSDLRSGKEKKDMLLQSQTAYELSVQLGKQTNNKNLLSNSYYAVSTINSALGNYKEAYYNYGMYITGLKIKFII